MRKSTFKRLLEDYSNELSSQAYNVLDCISDDLDTLTQDDIQDNLYNYLDGEFIYYSDAFDYLTDNNITDFEDAIKNYGAYDVCSIACYCLEQEIMNFLYEQWDYYESEEDEEDEDEEDE